MLDYYDSLQDAASRCFLQLLGLFDRPMRREEKAVLIANANHAELLRALTAKEWQALEQRLEKSGLLLGKKGSFERLEWDTHPIIRAYFGQKFKGNYPEAFKQAHLVLFEYFQKLPGKEFPDTLEEMQPLYRAVGHGCLAGLYEKTFKNVYQKCILRDNEYYSQRKLVAYSQELTALSFFLHDWGHLLENTLAEAEQIELFANVSFNLMSLGRLEHAIEPRKIDLALSKKWKNWTSAAIASRNLVDLYLALGQLKQAQIVAQQEIEYAQYSEDVFEQILSQSYLANVLLCSGQLSEAYKHFQQAEVLDQGQGNLYLLGLRGSRYCSFLLESDNDKNTLKAIIERADYSLQYQIKINRFLSIAVDCLTLARTYFILNELTQAKYHFEQAMENIQKANFVFFMPYFYLYRADFYLTQNQLDPAQADLNSAWEIIERSGMKLYAVDYLLIHGRYCLAVKDHDTALNHYEEAKQLIQETGYHLRDAELDLFAAQLRQLDLPEHQRTNPSLYSQSAEDYLQKAKNRIEEIGQWGLMPSFERVKESVLGA